MEMDRQTLFILVAAIVGLTLFGGAYLSSPSRDLQRPVYAQDDIRHKLHQEAEKEKLKRKGKKKPAPVQDDAVGDSSESDAEEPEAEEPIAEEPAID